MGQRDEPFGGGRAKSADQPVAWPIPKVPDRAPLRTTYAYDIGDRLKTV